MNLQRVLSIFYLLIIGILSFPVPSIAADLLVKLDKDKKIATVTNTLATKITMLFLVRADNNQRLPLYSVIEKGATVSVPIRFAIPESIDNATCEIASPPKDYEKGDDGYYHLSVELIQP